MNSKFLYRGLIVSFTALYLLVAFISFWHCIAFCLVGNPIWISIMMSFAFEVGLALTLFSILTTDNKSTVVPWILMTFLTFVQIIGNVYSVFKYMIESGTDFYKYINESMLFWFIEEAPQNEVQSIIAIILGALLPIVALLMTSMVSNNLKLIFKEGDAVSAPEPEPEPKPEPKPEREPLPVPDIEEAEIDPDIQEAVNDNFWEMLGNDKEQRPLDSITEDDMPPLPESPDEPPLDVEFHPGKNEETPAPEPEPESEPQAAAEAEPEPAKEKPVGEILRDAGVPDTDASARIHGIRPEYDSREVPGPRVFPFRTVQSGSRLPITEQYRRKT